jgi:hypothetical protein
MEQYVNASGRVDLFPVERMAVLSLYGEAPDRELRELFVELLDCTRAHGFKTCLTDFRSLLPFSAENAHWLSWTWFPAMRAAGWQYWASVQPTSLLARAGLQDFVEHFALLGVETRLFATAREARLWVRDLAREEILEIPAAG